MRYEPVLLLIRPVLAVLALYTWYSDVIDVIVITRCHVGGIHVCTKTKPKPENSYANVIRRPCFLTGV